MCLYEITYFDSNGTRHTNEFQAANQGQAVMAFLQWLGLPHGWEMFHLVVKFIKYI